MEESQSLRSLFASAKDAKTALESRGDTNTESYRDAVNAAIAKFHECQRQVSILSLFSSNESLDDVSTGDIQYMTLEYHLAELTQRGLTADREATLRRALEQYETFITRLDEYELLSAGDKKLFEQYMANSSTFTLAPLNDAAARRDIKVRRFREEKELKQKLEYLARNEARLQSDDDDTRRLYLAELQLYIHQSFQALDLLIQELSMLSAMRNAPTPTQTTPDDPRQRTSLGGANYSDRLDPSLSQLLGRGRGGPILNSKGKPMQPFTLLDRRTQLQQGVFRSGHNLPTMTIEEYLEEEHRRGNVLQGGEQSGMKPEVDEDDLDKADEETMKARAWDEYVEANPKGSGNTLNRG
ncbi:putative TOR signaling pathway regulator (TapA) [Penicillium brasilianum]|uniref:Putative TOR signaling pathway regulator (TapA) n=1 Tax=Penicillium brasilianum TaxID=104259 RepID=A0A1S9RVI2_PENBI|nr:putative TOR signaling pathway regulator (TapA) [Penicillium brasilianum]